MDNIYVYSFEEEQKDIRTSEYSEKKKEEERLVQEVQDFRKVFGFPIQKIKHLLKINGKA